MRLTSSSFVRVGMLLEYGSPSDLQQSHYSEAKFASAAPVMLVDSFPGEVRVTGCLFQENKVWVDLLAAVDATHEDVFSESQLVARRGLLQQSLVVARNHSRAFVMEHSRFSNNSALLGLVFVEASRAPVLLLNNSFSHNSAWRRALAFNLVSH